LFNFIKRGRAASQVKQYTAHWCAAMNTSFKGVTRGFIVNEKPLKLMNSSIILAAIMHAGLSGPRFLSAITDQLSHSYGFSAEEFQTSALMAKAILHGFDGEDTFDSQLCILKEVCPEYPFTLMDTDWFKTNINIIIDVMDTALRDSNIILRS